MSLLSGWIEIFRAGDYGAKGKYSTADLDQLAADYDPAKHEAPVVIGHPETNAPVFGWVDSLKRAGSTLLAKFQVVPAFAALVKAGRFKKRSVALNRRPDGTMQLRHVGFLESIECNEEEQMDVTGLRQSLVGALKEFFGTDASGDLATRTIQKLKDARRWMAAFDEMKLPAIFAELAKSETKIEFGEGDKKSTKTALEVLTNFLMGLPEVTVVKFTDSAFCPADPESIATSRAAQARATAMNIPFGEALGEIYAERAATGA